MNKQKPNPKCEKTQASWQSYGIYILGYAIRREKPSIATMILRYWKKMLFRKDSAPCYKSTLNELGFEWLLNPAYSPVKEPSNRQ